jgi:hypothetical protein
VSIQYLRENSGYPKNMTKFLAYARQYSKRHHPISPHGHLLAETPGFTVRLNKYLETIQSTQNRKIVAIVVLDSYLDTQDNCRIRQANLSTFNAHLLMLSISRNDVMLRKASMSLDDTAYYPCLSRCVRRNFLFDTDSFTHQSYDHRRQKILDRLKEHIGCFSVEC